MKAAVTLITLIIIVSITISIGLLLWFFMGGYFSQVRLAGENRTQRGLEVLSSCMKIEEAFQNKFFIRNCGNGVITNNTLNVYVDDELFNFDLDPPSIDGGKTGTLNLKAWGMSTGQHTLRITNPNTDIATLFEANLPDSCVLALDFDEGSGNIAHDLSGYNNHGTLYNGTTSCYGDNCPTWVDGKFGKAIKFDGIEDYINVPNSASLNVTEFTVIAWVYANSFLTYSAIVSESNGGGGGAWYWILYSPSGNLRAVIENSSGTSTTTSSILISTAKWYFTSIVVNSTHISLYVNDNLIGSSALTFTPRPFNAPLLISGYQPFFPGGTAWNGTIDELRVYNKALTPYETLNFRII